jgi:pyrroline-5-carboxylate reductase
VLARNEVEFHRLWSLTGLIAPYYRVMETLALWEAEGGVARETADAFIRALFQCLAAMADGAPLGALARQAQTPGGINEQALRVLEAAGAFGPWRAAMDAVNARMNKGGG